MYFIAKYDTKIFPIKKALGKKRPVIPQLLRKCSRKPTEYCQSPTKVETGRKTTDAGLSYGIGIVVVGQKLFKFKTISLRFAGDNDEKVVWVTRSNYDRCYFENPIRTLV